MLVAILTLPAQHFRAQGYWQEIAQLPVGKQLMSVETVDNLIYVIGGLSNPSLATSEVYAFNPVNKSLKARSPLPKALGASATTVLDGKIYVFGGVSVNMGTPTNSCYVYDPATNVWTSLASMTVARGYAVAEAINGKIFIIGGFGNEEETVYNVVEMYDPKSNTWETMAPMPTARGYMCSAVLNDHIYVIGGGLPFVNTSLDAVEIYDPVLDKWTSAPNLPTARMGAAAGVLGATIYVAGGANLLFKNSDLEIVQGYSQKKGWKNFAPVPIPIHDQAIAVFENKLYSFGGSSNGKAVDAIFKFQFSDFGVYSTLSENGLTVFPNPASERVTFTFEKAANCQLTLYRPDGTIVFTEKLQEEQQHDFSVAGLSTGVYFWKWNSADGAQWSSGKVYVEH